MTEEEKALRREKAAIAKQNNENRKNGINERTSTNISQDDVIENDDRTESDKIVEQDELNGKDNILTDTPDNSIGASGAKIAEEADKTGKDATEVLENNIEKTTDPLTSFSGTKTENQKLGNVVNKVTNGEELTEEDVEEAKTKVDTAWEELNNITAKAEDGLQPSKWVMAATIISAIISAATGGSIPFIPFSAITGDSQKIAYLNKLKATAAQKLSDEQTDQIIAASRNSDTAQENAEASGEVQYSKTGERAKDTANTENTMKINEQTQNFQKEFAKLNNDLQKQILELSANLRNKSPAEIERYMQEWESSLSKKDRNQYLKFKAQWGKNMSPAEYRMNLINQGVNAGTELINSGVNAAKTVLGK